MKKTFFICFFAFFLFSIYGCGPETDPIHDAVISKDMAKIKTLLDKGVSVDKTDSRGRTPLYWAALQGSKEIAEYLISRGAQINKGASWKSDSTPLHVAAQKGHTDIVELLLNKGANVNAANRVRKTPLHLAAWDICPETVEYLLKKGADVNVRDNRGYTPLHVENIFIEDKHNYKRVVEILIGAGADVNASATIRKGDTPLMGACIIGSEDVVDLLIANGAYINAKTEDGTTPLSLAIAYKHKEIEEILRKHGAK